MARDILEKIESGEIPVIIEEDASQTSCDEHPQSISNLLECQKTNAPSSNESDIRLSILSSSLENANTIYDLCKAEEKSKKFWRGFFILFFSILLLLSIGFLSVLIVLDAYSIIELSTEIIVGVFAYLFADILAIMYFMIQYINNSQYLESFKTITHKLLDYLIQDKATGNGNSPTEKTENTAEKKQINH